jgi:nucleotide-binding universal stress UspA family protein
MIGSILVALDGSPLAEQALPPAARLAAFTSANLLLVHAGRGQEAEAYMGAARDRLLRNGHRARAIVVNQTPADAILAVARREGAGVIAMSARAGSGPHWPALGSVADAVLRHTTLPMLLVRAANRPTPVPEGTCYRRILVPLDGSAAAERALVYVAREGLAGAEAVMLLRAIPAAIAPRVLPGLHVSARQLRENVIWETENARLAAREYLQTAANSYLRRTIPHFHVLDGYPAKVILDVAADWGIDLIVMSTRGAVVGREIRDGVLAHVLRYTGVPILCLPGTYTDSPPRDRATMSTADVLYTAPPLPFARHTQT